MTITADTQYVVHEKEHKGAPVLQLFTGGRAKMTILLWVINFMNLLNLYFLSNWLPTIAKEAGLSTANAVLAGTALQVGGTIGTLVMGQLIDRSSFRRILLPCFLVAAVAIALIGRPDVSLAFLFITIFIAGFCVVGGQPAVNALAASYYPTTLRSTGIGWSLGVGPHRFHHRPRARWRADPPELAQQHDFPRRRHSRHRLGRHGLCHARRTANGRQSVRPASARPSLAGWRAAKLGYGALRRLR